MRMRKLLMSAAVLLLVIATPFNAARAVDMPIVGDPGGNEFRIDCGPGQFVAGLTGRIGAWIDQIGILCASSPFRSVRGPLVPTGPLIGGQGGSSATAICPGEGVIDRHLFLPGHRR